MTPVPVGDESPIETSDVMLSNRAVIGEYYSGMINAGVGETCKKWRNRCQVEGNQGQLLPVRLHEDEFIGVVQVGAGVPVDDAYNSCIRAMRRNQLYEIVGDVGVQQVMKHRLVPYFKEI